MLLYPASGATFAHPGIDQQAFALGSGRNVMHVPLGLVLGRPAGPGFALYGYLPGREYRLWKLVQKPVGNPHCFEAL
jgi:hypothetical protein